MAKVKQSVCIRIRARAREKDVTFTKEFNAKCFAHKLPKNVIKKASLPECANCERFEPSRNLLSPWVSAPGLYLLHGFPNTGKTLLALGISYAIANGSKFLKWSADIPGRVLFVDNEWGEVNLQAQLKAVLADMNVEDKSLPIWFMSSGLPYDGPNLSERSELEALEKHVVGDNIDLIVLNSVASLCRSKQGKLKAWCLRMCDQGRAVLAIRNDYQGKKGRRTFRREDLFTTIIQMTSLEGCHYSFGRFRKARNLRGSAMKGFRIRSATF